MNIKLEIILFIFIGVIILIDIVWIIKTEKRLKRFFAGKKAKNLEENINILEENISNLKYKEEKVKKELIEINKKMKKSIRGLETIRFNPFSDQGSNQSVVIRVLQLEW